MQTFIGARKSLALLLVLAALVLWNTGCATVPYTYAPNHDNELTYRLKPGEPQIVRGRPYEFLDAADWYWPGSLFSKLILWNWKVDRHYISPESEEAIRQYLADNHLDSVKVRLNACSVGDEWRRTMRNKAVAPGWRYTLGFLSWLQYTIFPGRFFGGDNYNPYSNTINIYSDITPILLHEGGHSKDFARRTWKGTYAFMYILPFFALYPEAIATTDALSYLRAQDDVAGLRTGYHILYPAYGTYIGGSIGEWLPGPWYYVALAGGVIPGHIVGRIKGALVEPNPAGPQLPPDRAQ